jgi:hypothetical protein
MEQPRDRGRREDRHPGLIPTAAAAIEKTEAGSPRDIATRELW